MGKKTIQIGLSVVIIAGALGYLLTASMSEAVEYYHPADMVMVNKAQLLDQRIRMGGHVRKGSIAQKPGTLEYAFEVRPTPLEAKHAELLNQTIPVRFTGLVPDTFKDDATVVVSGELKADGIFYANDLTAKCPSKYEAADKAAGKY